MDQNVRLQPVECIARQIRGNAKHKTFPAEMQQDVQPRKDLCECESSRIVSCILLT